MQEQRKQLAMVRDSARHLLALINDVLDISKIEAGQLEVSSEPFDLRASIAKIAGIVKPLAEKKNLALRVELAPEIGDGGQRPAPRRTDAAEPSQQRHQVYRAGRGHAHGGNRAGTLRAPAIYISVADTGIGIKPEDLGELVPAFPANRFRPDASARGHRTGPGHLPAAGRVARRGNPRGERLGQRQRLHAHAAPERTEEL